MVVEAETTASNEDQPTTGEWRRGIAFVVVAVVVLLVIAVVHLGGEVNTGLQEPVRTLKP